MQMANDTSALNIKPASVLVKRAGEDALATVAVEVDRGSLS